MSFVRQAVVGSTALLALLLGNPTAGNATKAKHDAPAAQAAGETLVLHTAFNPSTVASLWNNSAADGTPVVLWPFVGQGTDNQKWEVIPVQGDWFQLRNKMTKTCLVNGFHHVDEDWKLAGYGCNPAYEDQLWTRVNVAGTDRFALVNKYSGKCMDQTFQPVPAQLVQHTCHGQIQQLWTATTA